MNTSAYNIVKNELPQEVTLVAVSKYFPSSEIREAYALGQREFAESRPQELRAKIAELQEECPGIRWNFIGHLQTNKLKMVLPYVSLVQSVDSEHLLEAISEYCVRSGIVVRVLLEVHIAHEESKQGFSFEELRAVVQKYVEGEYPGVTVCGLMGMASFSDEEGLVEGEFASLKALFDETRAGLPLGCAEEFVTLSMGMSGDYKKAIAAGATMVRIGSLIFA